MVLFAFLSLTFPTPNYKCKFMQNLFMLLIERRRGLEEGSSLITVCRIKNFSDSDIFRGINFGKVLDKEI